MDAVEKVDLTLPIPPTVNHYYGRRGKVSYLTKGAKAFRHEVAVAAMNAEARGAFLQGKLAVKVIAHLKTTQGDLDNRLKPLLDALEYADVIKNDRQVDDLRITRGAPVKGGRCEVTIWRM